jgi:hypothetical protein
VPDGVRGDVNPHPNPLPRGEGANEERGSGFMPDGVRGGVNPHPNPLPKGEGAGGEGLSDELFSNQKTDAQTAGRFR